MPSLLDAYTLTTDTHTLQERERECLITLRARFRQAVEREGDYRTAAVKALEFRNGQQWEPEEERKRLGMGRPCLTINTTAQYERQILNEQRQNRPRIKVRPVGNGADVETAKILQGVLRHIEERSHSDEAYDTAEEAAVRHGRGYFRILLSYLDPMSFEQELLIRRIRNPFMVYMDPMAQLPTYADAQWAILFELVPKTQHQQEYSLDTATLETWTSEGDTWVSTDEVRIAEYFFKDQTRYTLGKWVDGSTKLLEPLLLGIGDMLTDQERLDTFERAVAQLLTCARGRRMLVSLRQNAQQAEDWFAPLGNDFAAWYLPQVQDILTQLVDVRQTQLDTIWHCKTNGHCILEEGLWPGKYIPLIPVVGDELDINGQVHLSGYLRHAMDPMRMKNYWVTMQAEHIALSPVPPWLVAEGQVEGYEDLWATANKMPRAFLPYKPVDVRGNPVPPPLRNSYEAPIQAITLAMQGAERDTEATIGIYRSSLGARSNETSGRAILARDQQADTGTYHYQDNLRRAIRFCGEQLIDLIPKIASYSQAEILRILSEDGSPHLVRTEVGAQTHTVPEDDTSGIEGVYDLTTGTYDVVVDVGPSYQTKRQETLETLIELGKASPKIADIGADKLVGAVDAEGMDELERRLKKLLPPELLEEPTQGDPKAHVAQLQAGIQQLTQQLEQLNAYAQEGEQRLQATQQENERLRQKTALDMEQLALKEQEFALKVTIERERMALERDKLDFEALKLRHQREMAGQADSRNATMTAE